MLRSRTGIAGAVAVSSGGGGGVRSSKACIFGQSAMFFLGKRHNNARGC